MRVSKVSGPSRSGPARRAPPANGGTDFSVLVDRADGASDAGPVARVDAGTPATALLALQEVGGVDDGAGGGGRRRALARGEALLDRLEALRLDILAGRIAPARLEAIASLARHGREAGCPPEVADLLDAIELRAEVELAKYEQSRRHPARP